MAVAEVQSGLEGVVAFATEIAEPDKEGGSLRYRGVDIDDLVGKVTFEKVWGLLVDGAFEPGTLPDPLAWGGRPRPREGDRRLLDLRRRARHERIDLHGARRGLHRRRRRGRPVGGRGRAVRPTARRRPVASAADARRRGGERRRREIREGRPRP